MRVSTWVKASLLGLALASSPLAEAAPLAWSVGPDHTLQTPGRIVKFKMVSRRKALYLLTGHGDLKATPLHDETGKVPAIKIKMSNGSFMWYAFLGRNYAPWTEPLKLTLHEKVWVRSRSNWPAIRVFAQKITLPTQGNADHA
ncbi:hypothetical protein A6M27_12530 [Acidithiobacillus thiooxidans]|uniref:hypothetical protein n=2 Tax=Acidithiobacillus thiooxidans TaxID=930 RepID=UPI000464D6BB|nr:hypothetical protein [Acidithiobacillus thiooxidans]OCX83516.1 hypothetical protein A6O26_06835 [Acidithiobacillus thiooxidans]OCX86477.1 hypothetical protein A6M27_12530 [Acidithiobacillus thiooxidans]OFC48710.1 hypothetical protein BAE47_06725 [Acidithiobacillus thiooxidans]